MLDIDYLKRKLIKSMLNALGCAAEIFMAISILMAAIIAFMVPSGKFSILHVFAMCGISGAFAVITAVIWTISDSVNT